MPLLCYHLNRAVPWLLRCSLMMFIHDMMLRYMVILFEYIRRNSINILWKFVIKYWECLHRMHVYSRCSVPVDFGVCIHLDPVSQFHGDLLKISTNFVHVLLMQEHTK
eukprot:378708_1